MSLRGAVGRLRAATAELRRVQDNPGATPARIKAAQDELSKAQKDELQSRKGDQ